jgi:hypothetical protein
MEQVHLDLRGSKHGYPGCRVAVIVPAAVAVVMVFKFLAAQAALVTIVVAESLVVVVVAIVPVARAMPVQESRGVIVVVVTVTVALSMLVVAPPTVTIPVRTHDLDLGPVQRLDGSVVELEADARENDVPESEGAVVRLQPEARGFVARLEVPDEARLARHIDFPTTTTAVRHIRHRVHRTRGAGSAVAVISGERHIIRATAYCSASSERRWS